MDWFNGTDVQTIEDFGSLKQEDIISDNHQCVVAVSRSGWLLALYRYTVYVCTCIYDMYMCT